MDKSHLTQTQDLLGLLSGNLADAKAHLKALKAFQPRSAEGLQFAARLLKSATKSLSDHASELDALADALCSCVDPACGGSAPQHATKDVVAAVAATDDHLS